jgi:Na+-driven multidrug efflux pump
LLVGVAGLIGIVSLIFTSSPLIDLTEDEEKVLSYEKKYLWIILTLIGINILGFYLVYYFGGGSPNDNRLLMSFTTILGFGSLFGFFLGLIISVFPYKKMSFANKYKRGTVLGQLIIQSIMTVIYIIAVIMMLIKK